MDTPPDGAARARSEPPFYIPGARKDGLNPGMQGGVGKEGPADAGRFPRFILRAGRTDPRV